MGFSKIARRYPSVVLKGLKERSVFKTRKCLYSYQYERSSDQETSSDEENSFKENKRDEDYKPDFFLDFDQQGRLLLYKKDTEINKPVSALFIFIYGLVLYKLFYKYKDRGLFGKIFYGSIFLTMSIIFKNSFQFFRKCVKTLHLYKDGKKFIVKPNFTYGDILIDIKSIPTQIDLFKNQNDFFFLSVINTPQFQGYIDIKKEPEIFIYDSDLLLAVLNGRHITIDEKSNDIIDL